MRDRRHSAVVNTLSIKPICLQPPIKPMKPFITIVAILLGSLATAAAQDFYLPVSSTSKTAIASYRRGADLYNNVHFTAGKAEFDKALAEDPTFFSAYLYPAQFGPQADRPALMDKALALDTAGFTPAEKIVRRWLVSYKADPKSKAGETMKALVEAYPKSPQALFWASLHAAWTDKDEDAALDYAQKLEKLNPTFATNYNSLGYLYAAKKDMTKAKAAFEKQLALIPNEANAYDSMGEFYGMTKDYAKSAEYYDKAAALGLAVAKERADKARAMLNN